MGLDLLRGAQLPDLREQQNEAAHEHTQQGAKANLAVTQLQELREHAAPIVWRHERQQPFDHEHPPQGDPKAILHG